MPGWRLSSGRSATPRGACSGSSWRCPGRARADLQYRLAEATRGLLADLRNRYRGSTERLAAAVAMATAIRAEGAGECERRLAGLAARQDSLRAVLSWHP